MNNFGLRLREERERLGFSQEQLGAIGGVKKLAQLKYEKGERKPDVDYLSAVEKVGVDYSFVISGNRKELPSSIPADEQLLIDTYRSLPITKRRELLASLLKGEPMEKENTSTRKSGIKQRDNNGMQITGDNNTQIGSVNN